MIIKNSASVLNKDCTDEQLWIHEILFWLTLLRDNHSTDCHWITGACVSDSGRRKELSESDSVMYDCSQFSRLWLIGEHVVIITPNTILDTSRAWFWEVYIAANSHYSIPQQSTHNSQTSTASIIITLWYDIISFKLNNKSDNFHINSQHAYPWCQVPYLPRKW